MELEKDYLVYDRKTKTVVLSGKTYKECVDFIINEKPTPITIDYMDYGQIINEEIFNKYYSIHSGVTQANTAVFDKDYAITQPFYNYQNLYNEAQTYTLSTGKTTDSLGEKMMDECGYNVSTSKLSFKDISVRYVRKVEIESGWTVTHTITFYKDNHYECSTHDYYFGEATTSGLSITPELHKAINQVLLELKEAQYE